MVTKINFADQPFLILSVSQDISGAQMTKLAEELKDELKKVPGVSKVEISGTRKHEIQVVIRKDQISKYGLSYNQVIAALVNLPSNETGYSISATVIVPIGSDAFAP